jgi:hypothetical protein
LINALLFMGATGGLWLLEFVRRKLFGCFVP